MNAHSSSAAGRNPRAQLVLLAGAAAQRRSRPRPKLPSRYPPDLLRRRLRKIIGDPAGLRDLARMCLALSDPRVPHGAYIHLDAGINPLDLRSASLMLARD